MKLNKEVDMNNIIENLKQNALNSPVIKLEDLDTAEDWDKILGLNTTNNSSTVKENNNEKVFH